MVRKRLGLALINIFFPPLTILLLCGPETDLIINCLLFLAAVIPSHIHAFYISCTYFNRKSKVRKGVWPGKWRWGIYSERVQNGGASEREVRRLKKREVMAAGGGQEGDRDRCRDYDEGDGGRGKSKRKRGSGYGNNTGYGYESESQVQQVSSRSRTRDSAIQPEMPVRHVPSRSRTRNSGL